MSLRIGLAAAAMALIAAKTVPPVTTPLLLVSASCAVYLLLCALWAHSSLLVVWSVLVPVLLGLSVLSLNLVDAQRFEMLSRYAVVFIAFSLTLAGRNDLSPRFAPFCAAALITFAAIYAATHGLTYYSGYFRFTTFSGGVHGSALAVCAAMIIIWFSEWRPQPRLAWMVLGAIMLVGYSTITVLIMAAIVFTGYVFLQRRWPMRMLVFPIIVAITISAVIRDRTAVGGGVTGEGIGSIGSGRLGSWLERATLFWERPLLFKLVGTGPGSDFRPTELWWWEAKVAHSEWLTILMEFGIYGVLMIALLMAVIFKLANMGQRVVLMALLVGMFLSNIILERPTLALLWGFALLMINDQTVRRRLGTGSFRM